MKITGYISKIFALVLITLLAILVQNCRKDDTNSGSNENKYQMVFYPEELGICEEFESSFNFRLNPAAELKWNVVSKPEWLNLSPQSGTTNFSNSQTINISVGQTGFGQGRYKEKIKISVSGNIFSYFVTLVIDNESSSVEFNKPSLNFPLTKDYDTLIVVNNEDFSLNWIFNEIPDYIICDTQGYFINDTENTIPLRIDRSGLIGWGTVKDTLTFETSIGTNYKIPVSVDYNQQGGMWELPFNIVDAVFNYETNKIIAVASEPNSVVIIDPANREWESIPLSKTPLCISINKEGSFAAIGHDAFFTYVNLLGGSVENIYPVSAKVSDILLGEDGFVYVFPDITTNHHDYIFSVNLLTGEEIESTGVYYDNFSGCFDYSGEHIYAITVGTNPEDIYKFRIDQNIVGLMYDSPYHGDYPFGDRLWVSKEGDKIFTSKTVLYASNDSLTDLLYAGTIPEQYKMCAFDDAPQFGFFAGIMKDISSSTSFEYSYLVICSLESYEKMLSFALPTYTKPGNNGYVYYPSGKFVFINTEGNQVWVIQRTPDSYPLNEKWDLVSYKLEIK